MKTRSRPDRFCRGSLLTVFVAMFAVGQCMAQNPAAMPAQSGPQALKDPEIPAAFNRQPDAIEPGSASTQAAKAGSMTDRAKDRGRKFPARDRFYYSDRLLARIIHEGSSRGGADGHGYKAREGRIPQAYLTVLEESDRAQHGSHAWMRRRSRNPVRNAD